MRTREDPYQINELDYISTKESLMRYYSWGYNPPITYTIKLLHDPNLISEDREPILLHAIERGLKEVLYEYFKLEKLTGCELHLDELLRQYNFDRNLNLDTVKYLFSCGISTKPGQSKHFGISVMAENLTDIAHYLMTMNNSWIDYFDDIVTSMRQSSPSASFTNFPGFLFVEEKCRAHDTAKKEKQELDSRVPKVIKPHSGSLASPSAVVKTSKI